MAAEEEVVFPGDDVINETMNCVRLAQNEICLDESVAKIDDLTQAALIDRMEGNLLFGVVVLRKSLWYPSYHCLPGDETKVREKAKRGHIPVLTAALWNGSILCAETDYKLIDLDEASTIDPHMRERLKTLYTSKNG